MTQLLEFVNLCEKATGPDRELDAQIWLAVTPGATRKASVVKSSKGLWADYTIDETRDETYRLIVVPTFTASIDAAMTLVPAGMQRLVRDGVPGGDGSGNDRAFANLGRGCEGRGDTIALALCAAALRARSRHPVGHALGQGERS